jgi:hypothetical protein
VVFREALDLDWYDIIVAAKWYDNSKLVIIYVSRGSFI